MSKKITLLMAAFFALAACSEDVYQEIDQQNEDMMAPPTFNNDEPGWINDTGSGPYINPGDGYHSPWDIWFRNHPFTPIYHFVNDAGISGHSSPFYVEITPWVGLAYFDGNNNDGHYRDPYLGGTSVANFLTGNYPNLYANNQEVGNLMPAQPIILDGLNLDGSHVVIVSDHTNPNVEHLPRTPAFLSPIASNANNQVFNVIGATAAERTLLADYGKVFYFQVDVRDGVTLAPIINEFVQIRNEDLENVPIKDYWISAAGLQANVPGAGLKDVYYYYNNTLAAPGGTVWGPGTPGYPTGPGGTPGTYICDSREVAIDRAHANEIIFEYPFGSGIEYRIIAAVPIGSWLWQTSGPYVGVIPK